MKLNQFTNVFNTSPQSNGPLYSNTVIGLAVDDGRLQEGPRWGPAQSSPHNTKPNSPAINGQCTNFVLFDVAHIMFNQTYFKRLILKFIKHECGAFMAASINFTVEFYTGKDIWDTRCWDTRCSGVPASLRPRVAASSCSTRMRQSANGRQLRVCDRQTNDVICIIFIISISSVTHSEMFSRRKASPHTPLAAGALQEKNKTNRQHNRI